MCESGKTRVACLPVMLIAAAVLLFGPGPAFAEQDEVPVFVIGSDGGLSPFVMWRDSKEFREVVFPSMAEALARAGIRAIGEEPFRSMFNVDGVAGDFLSRWDCLDFLQFAPQAPVDDAGNTAQYVVCIDVWLRTCRDDATFLCSVGGAVLDDLEQVAAVLGAELRHPPVVDDQDGGLGDRGEQLGIAPVGARDGQLGEQAWEAPVRDGVSVAARAVSEGAGYPTLSHAGQASDILMRITAN